MPFIRLWIYPDRERGGAMEIFDWPDRREQPHPRAIIQQGRCDKNSCGQFSISISNGERGLTVRFESEAEFRAFIERGEVEAR